MLEVLDPLEVGDDDAAGVGHHVGDDEDALVVEDLVRLRGGGRVRALDHHPAVEKVGVVGVDHPAERGGDEHVARGAQELLAVDGLAAVELVQPPAGGDVAGEGVGVQAAVVAHGAMRVGGSDHRRAELLHHPRRPRADVRGCHLGFMVPRR